jgi:UDP-N-acetylmuramyl tripeptide synthase
LSSNLLDRPEAVRVRHTRDRFAVLVGRAVSGYHLRTGRPGGSFAGGRAALRISPRVLSSLAGQFTVTLVSGTNGKTTTTRLAAEALATSAGVVSNSLGANLPDGITTALLSAGSEVEHAVLEVDERHLPRAVLETDPSLVLLLNLSRDQLDRNPECRLTAESWTTVLAGTRATVVANADDPWIVWACRNARRVVWVSVRQRWTDDSWVCPGCGNRLVREGRSSWKCTHCTLSRPSPRWTLDKGRAVDSQSGTAHLLSLRLPGRMNEANATMALAAARIHGVPAGRALSGMADVGSVSGRYEDFQYQGRRVRLLLVKNPASWLETMDVLTDSPRVLFSLNARELDGLDTSWLWDVDFSGLRNRSVFVTGERRYDIATRLYYEQVPFQMVDSLAAACVRDEATDVSDRLDVVANYTAFLSAIRTVRSTGPQSVEAGRR